VTIISPEWVRSPEQGKSSGRTANFSLWTGTFWDGISSIRDETVTLLGLSRRCLVCGNRVYRERLDRTGYRIMHH
jgi:hypothetical protein